MSNISKTNHVDLETEAYTAAGSIKGIAELLSGYDADLTADGEALSSIGRLLQSERKKLSQAFDGLLSLYLKERKKNKERG